MNNQPMTAWRQVWYFISKNQLGFRHSIPIHSRALLAAILCCLATL